MKSYTFVCTHCGVSMFSGCDAPDRAVAKIQSCWRCGTERAFEWIDLAAIKRERAKRRKDAASAAGCVVGGDCPHWDYEDPYPHGG